MAHTCSTALIRCIDFRLGGAIRDYMNANNLYDDTDIISLAGAVKDLAQNENGYLEGQIDLSHQLHSTNTVILMNHTDCGGYGGRAAFENREAENAHHHSELKKGKEKILAKHPDITVKLALAHIEDDGSVRIEDIE